MIHPSTEHAPRPRGLVSEPSRFPVIYADPPWHYQTRSPKGRDRCPDGPRNHYKTQILDILKPLPVGNLATRHCVLLMWATGCHMAQALELGAAWGFTYRTVGFVWVKTTVHGKQHYGGGQWTRKNPEHCLLFGRGDPSRRSKAVRELIMAEGEVLVARKPLEHSRKPDEVYPRIEELLGGPYVELFARQRWPGWHQAFSDEADKFPIERRRVEPWGLR